MDRLVITKRWGNENFEIETTVKYLFRWTETSPEKSFLSELISRATDGIYLPSVNVAEAESALAVFLDKIQSNQTVAIGTSILNSMKNWNERAKKQLGVVQNDLKLMKQKIIILRERSNDALSQDGVFDEKIAQKFCIIRELKDRKRSVQETIKNQKKSEEILSTKLECQKQINEIVSLRISEWEAVVLQTKPKKLFRVEKSAEFLTQAAPSKKLTGNSRTSIRDTKQKISCLTESEKHQRLQLENLTENIVECKLRSRRMDKNIEFLRRDIKCFIESIIHWGSQLTSRRDIHQIQMSFLEKTRQRFEKLCRNLLDSTDKLNQIRKKLEESRENVCSRADRETFCEKFQLCKFDNSETENCKTFRQDFATSKGDDDVSDVGFGPSSGSHQHQLLRYLVTSRFRNELIPNSGSKLRQIVNWYYDVIETGLPLSLAATENSALWMLNVVEAELKLLKESPAQNSGIVSIIDGLLLLTATRREEAVSSTQPVQEAGTSETAQEIITLYCDAVIQWL